MGKIFITLLWFSLMQSCVANRFSRINNGDLIFVTAKQEDLSGAISRVTQDGNGVSFDHVGIIAGKNGRFVVYHASPNGGSQKQNLEDFLVNVEKDKSEAVVYRLKPEYRNAILSALHTAENMLGKPYNFSYVLDENSYYCSDYVERAFRDSHIFRLEPMTFKNPQTGKTDEYWQQFYTKMNMEVPEGKPGCNPNGLSKSDKIRFVKLLK